MGILDNIGKSKTVRGLKGGAASRARPAAGEARAPAGHPSAAAAPPATARPRTAPSATPGRPGSGSKLPGKRGRKSAGASPRERVASAAAPLHDRRRRLVGAREATLRDLGGLMLEMYKRNRFREELLLDKCEEVLAVEVEIAHVDQRLFQLAPPNAAGMRPIGRCECDAPIHPGQNFCGVCGRSFATLTQARSCARCGAGLRRGDQYCSTCGTEAPEMLQLIEPPSGEIRPGTVPLDPASIASSAVARTVVINAPPAPGVTGTPFDSTTPPLEAPGATVDAATSVLPVAEPTGPPTPVHGDAPPSQPPVPERETGFSWAERPQSDPETAIGAAIDAMPNPTDPDAPFTGFPLTSTVPPPPIPDPVDLALPPLITPHAGQRDAASPVRPEAAPPSQAALRAPAAPPATASAPSDADAKAAKAAARTEAKALATDRKRHAKDARARAKEKAKAARDARKRGGRQ